MSGHWAGSNRRHELPSNWSSTVAPRILKRDGHRCTWTELGQRCTARATEVDHAGDKHDHRDSNLRSLCTPHHMRHTQAQAAAARARRSPRRAAAPHPSKGGG